MVYLVGKNNIQIQIKNLNLSEGWTIKDWKMAKSKNGSDWTFILEKTIFS